MQSLDTKLGRRFFAAFPEKVASIDGFALEFTTTLGSFPSTSTVLPNFCFQGQAELVAQFTQSRLGLFMPLLLERVRCVDPVEQIVVSPVITCQDSAAVFS
jgi:hypothetical protein